MELMKVICVFFCMAAFNYDQNSMRIKYNWNTVDILLIYLFVFAMSQCVRQLIRFHMEQNEMLNVK